MIERTASSLAKQKAVGWFQGRMEFGPRALGARSTLGDPRSAMMQKNLNLKIKYRESFRPFAPSVLREDVSEWFELGSDSPYMLVVADVRNERRRTMTCESDYIPYLAQVYDDVWAWSFGTAPDQFDRWIASKRLDEVCQRIGAGYIDTTPDFVAAVHARKHWLHWAQDAHPTPEGQDLIAQVIADELKRTGIANRSVIFSARVHRYLSSSVRFFFSAVSRPGQRDLPCGL
jgi:hypothetical protein